jgi:XTP/dITP diphosphohydrolase
MKIICATQNSGKLIEVRTLLAGLGLTILSASEVGIIESPEETGPTFEENALLKARFVSERTNEWALADDAGICFFALNNEPGVNTARWAGPDATDDDRIMNALDKMKQVPEGQRQAIFHSAVALVAPDGQEWVFNGSVAGSLTLAPRGVALPRLPFDRLFVPDGGDQTFAEMTADEKNAISHRARAMRKLAAFLNNYLEMTRDA